MSEFEVEKLNNHSYEIFLKYYKAEQYKYIQYLTIFNRFEENYNFEQEDSLLLCCKPNKSSFTFLGLRGLSFESPRMSIYVPSIFSKKGYAKTLIDIATHLTYKLKYKYLELKVDMRNLPALNLYRNKGFLIYKKASFDKNLILRKQVFECSLPTSVIFNDDLIKNYN